MSPQPGNFRRGGNRGNAFAERSPAEIARIHRAYIDNELPLKEICRRFNMTDHELTVIRDREGWKARGQSRKPRISSHRRVLPKRRTEAQARADNLADAQARDVSLYGKDLADVRYLRWRGFVIDRHDIHPTSQGVRVGNQIVTFAQLREKADRERRLDAAVKRVEPQPAKLRRGGAGTAEVTSSPAPAATTITIKRRARR